MALGANTVQPRFRSAEAIRVQSQDALVLSDALDILVAIRP